MAKQAKHKSVGAVSWTSILHGFSHFILPSCIGWSNDQFFCYKTVKQTPLNNSRCFKNVNLPEKEQLFELSNI